MRGAAHRLVASDYTTTERKEKNIAFYCTLLHFKLTDFTASFHNCTLYFGLVVCIVMVVMVIGGDELDDLFDSLLCKVTSTRFALLVLSPPFLVLSPFLSLDLPPSSPLHLLSAHVQIAAASQTSI